MQTIDKKHLWAKFCSWVTNHRKVILIVSGAVVLLTAAALTYLFVFYKPNTTGSTPETQLPKAEPVKVYSILTGQLVAEGTNLNQAVTGVMIENSPEARPQSGLKEAGVVFEAICEGGITRFLALYQTEKPQLIGPVRSVRMYYIDWAAGFNASIAHIGGNIDALAEVRNGVHRDLDEFFNADTYWRSTDRDAPHNVYTSFAKLDALNAEKGYTRSVFTGFARADGAPVATPDATSITVNISSELFNSSYVYNATTNTYARYQAGAAHNDRELGQITPSVVIAMYVNESTIPVEEGYEESIGTINSGKAVIFQNGTAITGTWTKTSQKGQISFKDAAGIEIPLVRGQTWIAAVPNGDGAVTWQ
ncbi:MAG: DUF3048 domain-containing protein [Candidatus Saccharibacteria bacterium]